MATDYQLKANRILRCALGLAAAGIAIFWTRGGLDSALAFAAASAMSVGGLWVLARGIDILGAGRNSWLKGLGFALRIFVYALAVSAILKVYPERSLEIFFGVFLPILAISLEALYESFYHART